MSDLKQLRRKVGKLLIKHGVSYQQPKRVVKHAREYASEVAEDALWQRRASERLFCLVS